MKWLSGLSGFSAAFFWFKGTQRTLELKAPDIVTINPHALNDGISFMDSIIVNKNQKTVKIFSARCTHLGCKITTEQNGKLICPCHGSQFTFSGQVEKGPAVKPLKTLPYSVDKNSGEMTVYVS
ncbi:MAG: ubiquinol-cytochrome c reductase iron-sulfur subunit [Calditrichae bacterium]|nr:ubiquinol-cytochrome c reductase iron-sulfur subunit [Calditrichota bacterium]MCB9057848.1 ubiquinol-cytochrome c reductase iron-sulfur subunit [Calditrichia bacterium]